MKATRTEIATLDRLKRRSDFLRVQKTGRKWVSKTLVLQVADNSLEKCRYGITVSKKTSKSAVIRNRIRRRLRAMLCDSLPEYAKTGVDYVLIGRVAAENCSYAALMRDFRWCLKRMALRKDLPDTEFQGTDENPAHNPAQNPAKKARGAE